MNYLSVCSGIEAATVAWHPLGWKPVAFAEIDKHASAVLKHHYPEVPNVGDFTTIGENDYEAVELIVGGPPCQSYSQAGKREGLNDPRGNLTLEFIRLVERIKPRWLVFENVPGILSVDEGRTFGTILAEMGKCGYGFAYRVLDAQYIRTQRFTRAVPQRRRRVFVVGHLGDWRPPAAVLFDSESMSRHSPPSRKKGSATSATVASNLGTGGFNNPDFVTAITAHIQKHNCGFSGDETRHFVSYDEDVLAIHRNGILETRNSQKTGLIRDSGEAYCLDGQTPANAVLAHQKIRRITPLECERLQGFPDNYTLIDYRSKPMVDSTRYQLLGNSMAVNVMEWIGSRIKMFEDMQ